MSNPGLLVVHSKAGSFFSHSTYLVEKRKVNLIDLCYSYKESDSFKSFGMVKKQRRHLPGFIFCFLRSAVATEDTADVLQLCVSKLFSTNENQKKS